MLRSYDHYRIALTRIGLSSRLVAFELAQLAAIDAALDCDDSRCPDCGERCDKALRDPQGPDVTAEYFCRCGFMHVRPETFN